MAVIAFDTVTGQPVVDLPATGWSWSKEVSTSGRFQAELAWSLEASELDLRAKTRPWQTVLADVRGSEVVASGVVYHRKKSGSKMTFQCVGFEDILDKLPVINHALDAMDIDGRVLDPTAEGVVIPVDWQQTFTGASVGDILVQLVESGMLWQPLPIDTPGFETGDAARTYWSTDLATVRDRIDDIASLEDGVEWRLDPYLDGRQLRHRLVVGDPEVRAETHIIDSTLPDTVFADEDWDEDASKMQTDVWGKGGVQDDQILMARHREPTLENEGAPRLFGVLESHDTVSELATLQAYVRDAAVIGSFSQEVWSFTIDRTQFNVMPGDWVDLKYGKQGEWVPPGWYGLKILSVSGDHTDRIKLQGRQRYA